MAAYTTEILPYRFRAKGYVWLNFSVSCSLFFNQYVNAIALEKLAWKYYLVYIVFIVFEVGVVYFFLVETKYTPMEEIAKFFDGDEAPDVADIANAHLKEMRIEDGQANVEHSGTEKSKTAGNAGAMEVEVA